MLGISNTLKTILARAQKLRGRFTLTAALYTVVILLLFTGSATATNAYITGETPKEFLVRLTNGVQNTREDQNLEEELVLGVAAEESKEEETNTAGEVEPTPMSTQAEGVSQPTPTTQSNTAPVVPTPANSEAQTGITEDTTATEPASGESEDKETDPAKITPESSPKNLQTNRSNPIRHPHQPPNQNLPTVQRWHRWPNIF